MRYLEILFLGLAFFFFQVHSFSQSQSADRLNPYEEFQTINKVVSLLTAGKKETKEILTYLDENWDDRFVPMLLDVLYLPGDQIDRKSVLKLLRKKTNQNYKKTWMVH